MEPILFDTETVGLTGPIVLLQYARGLNGPVKLVNMWKITIGQAIEELETIVKNPGGVVAFNIVFDHFHICQMLTTLYLMSDYSAILQDCVAEYAINEPKARFGPCIKPVKACDLMLHARKGPYQSVMDRKDIKIKRVPTVLAWPLAEELEKRIKLKKIFFGRKKNHERCWEVEDIKEDDGKINKDFKNVVLKFAATSALKAIASDALGVEVIKYDDIALKDYPNELGYAPYALAIGTPEKWNNAWPEIIHRHISHWTYSVKAREYAELDVIYLQKLYTYFGSPALGDVDSELACMVAAIRWRGFSVDLLGLAELRKKTANKNRKYISKEEAQKMLFPECDEDNNYYFKIPTAPAAAKRYLEAVMGDMEKMVLEGSTKRPILETVSKWVNDDNVAHPAAERAKDILEARQCNYEVDFYDKILLARRFHASSSIIGSLSGRMSGGGSAKGIEFGGSAKGDGLNPLGVKRTKEVRSKFTLADNGLVLCGGDFSGFEVALAEALYNDPDLRSDLQSRRPCHKCKGEGCEICNGKGTESVKIHALFGQFLFPKMTYDEIVASAGTKEDFYEKSKRGFFATLYGGEAETLNNRIGISIEDAAMGLHMFGQKYKKVGEYQAGINNKCCSMRQPGGIGTRVEWHEPEECAVSMFGFKRYYTLENMITKALFALASDPPKAWRDFKIKVVRRDRTQSAYGALQSSLYGAAFAIQAANMRSWKNHEIQSSGAEITKIVQKKIWEIQPSGVHEWLVAPLNVHDELQCPCHPNVIEQVSVIVHNAVESFRERVPLIKMDWSTNLTTWADKS